MDNGHRLYICGTNAHNPKDHVLNVSYTDYIVTLYSNLKYCIIFIRNFNFKKFSQFNYLIK